MRIDLLAEIIFDGNVEEVEMRIDSWNDYLIIKRKEGNCEEVKLNIGDVEEILHRLKKGGKNE